MTKTNEAVIAAMMRYPNAYIEYTNDFGKFSSKFDWTAIRDIGTKARQNMTLLLHPLSVITDEHIDEIWIILDNNEDYNGPSKEYPTAPTRRDHLFKCIEGTYRKCPILTFSESRSLSDYLRSHNYCIDPDLVECGIVKLIS